MDSEKVGKFIAATQVDQNIARQLLQSENWDVDAALKTFNLLRGSSPVHHGGRKGNWVKPPVAPKPTMESRLNYDTNSRMDNDGLTSQARHGPSKIRDGDTNISEALKNHANSLHVFAERLQGNENISSSVMSPVILCSDHRPQSSISESQPGSFHRVSPTSTSAREKNALLMERLENVTMTSSPDPAKIVGGVSVWPSSSQVSVNNHTVISVNDDSISEPFPPRPYNDRRHASPPPPTVPHTEKWTGIRLVNIPPEAVAVNGISVEGCNAGHPPALEWREKSSFEEEDHGYIFKNIQKAFQRAPASVFDPPLPLYPGQGGKDEVDRVALPPIALSTNGSSFDSSKPFLSKGEAVDLEDYDYYKKLSRGISKATDNVTLVSKARSELAQGIWDALDSSKTPFFVETPVFTFTLPDLTIYADDFRHFLEKDLVETSTLVSLEAAGRLNWWNGIGAAQRLWPLATTGDGNCLLHAASLGMWGFHDRLLTLRKALHEFLTRSEYSRPLWRRWRWELSQQNQQTGLILTDEEWENEWASVLRLASSVPRGSKDEPINAEKHEAFVASSSKRLSNGFLSRDYDSCGEDMTSGRTYESLEEVHVLALAHVLRRPIIVVADTTLKDVSGEPLAPIPFGGIYLPLECPPSECQRSPLLLTYDAAHFSALVIMECQNEGATSQLPAVIPLTDYNHELLPILFVIDPGDDFVWGRDDVNPIVIQKLTIPNHDRIGLLNEYLDVAEIPIPTLYLESAEEINSPDNSSSSFHPDVDKRSSNESSFDSDDGGASCPDMGGGASLFGGKARASKQLQTVAKQFGSLGRSMSKRLRKNLGNLSKLGRTGSFRGGKRDDEYSKSLANGVHPSSRQIGGFYPRVSTSQTTILCARVHTEPRRAYQEEMIRNYLTGARLRYDKDRELRRRQEAEAVRMEKAASLARQAKGVTEGPPIQCINAGCRLYGTAGTSYMCQGCFARQKEHEREYKRQTMSAGGLTPALVGMGGLAGAGFPMSPRAPRKFPSNNGGTNGGITPPNSASSNGGRAQYGVGKSQFYAELDNAAVQNAAKIPTAKPLSSRQNDASLYLANSTFYSDTSTVPSYKYSQKITKNSSLSKQSTIDEQRPDSSPPALGGGGESPSSPPMPALVTTALGSQAAMQCAPVEVSVEVHQVGLSVPPEQPFVSSDSKFDNQTNRSCLTPSCAFYGGAATGGYCSQCYNGRGGSGSGRTSAAAKGIVVQIKSGI